MKPFLNDRFTALAMRRAALVLDIGRQRAAMGESRATLRAQLAWAGLAVMAGRSLQSRGWPRVLALGALAVALVRRFNASAAV
jgi:hypothetical protein